MAQAPSPTPATAAQRPPRRSFAVPTQKLAVAEIPGYVLHWFRNEPDRVARAIEAGYEFVSRDEVSVPQSGVGTATKVDGNTDLGSRVSVVAGGTGGDGQPSRLILMKLPVGLRKEDERAQFARSEQLIKALSAGQIGADVKDPAGRYVGSNTSLPDFLRAKTPK